MSDNNFRKGPHASKNKPFETDVEVVTDATVPSSDERKTVVLDEDLDGVEFEDRVWLYWKRNKTSLITSIAAAFAIIICVQGFKMYRANAQVRLANEYALAQTPEQLAKFAAENAGKKLAGVALLQNADKLYSEGKFAEAQKIYVQAESDLGGTILEGRALIGEAACVSVQDTAKGIDLFKKVASNASIDPSYKAQAAYLLGLTYQQTGKKDEAKAAFKSVIDNANSGYFGKLAENSLANIN